MDLMDIFTKEGIKCVMKRGREKFGSIEDAQMSRISCAQDLSKICLAEGTNSKEKRRTTLRRLSAEAKKRADDLDERAQRVTRRAERRTPERDRKRQLEEEKEEEKDEEEEEGSKRAPGVSAVGDRGHQEEKEAFQRAIEASAAEAGGRAATEVERYVRKQGRKRRLLRHPQDRS